MMLTNERARSRAAFSEPPDLLTVAEVARLLRWDPTAVRRHLKSGVIPAWAVVPLPHRGGGHALSLASNARGSRRCLWATSPLPRRRCRTLLLHERMLPMRCLSLFSGIGGIDLAAQAVGFEIAAFCEIDPFCRSILHQHWPDVPLYSDVKEVSYDRLERDGRLPIDLVYGGVPCQPASLAGKRQGSRDERWLWPEFLRVVGELRPRWIVAENPVGILSVDHRRAWGAILGTLVELGYRAGWGVWGAADVGAPHRRERVFLLGSREPALADADGSQWRAQAEGRQNVADRQNARWQETASRSGLRREDLADTANRQCQQWTQSETGWDERPERRNVWGNPGRYGDAVADAACREDRWRGERGIQSDLASNGPAVANAQSGQCQRGWSAWTGQPRFANCGDALAHAANARLEERASLRRDASPQRSSALRTGDPGRESGTGGVEVSQCGLGGDAARVSTWVDDPRWPAGPGQVQAVWEPPRTIPRGIDPYRRKRLHALGNAVVPAQIAPLFRAIAEAEQRQRVP